MNTQDFLSNKWEIFFKKLKDAEIEYVKKRCPECRNGAIEGYRDCTHSKIDFKLMNSFINRKLKNESKNMFNRHLTAQQS